MLAGITDAIIEQISKGLSNEKINPPITANESFSKTESDAKFKNKIRI